MPWSDPAVAPLPLAGVRALDLGVFTVSGSFGPTACMARLMARQVPRRPELLPELVAPGIAFLASSACNESGVVLLAAGGRFQTAEWIDQREIHFGRTPVDPELIGARWQEICGT